MNTHAAPGPRIEALRACLSPEGLGAAVQRAGLGAFDTVAISRVHFSDRRPTVLHLRLTRGARSQTMLAEFVGAEAAHHAEAETARLTKSRRAQIGKGSVSPMVADPVSGLALRPPGLDARLPGLRLLHDAQTAAEVMARATGQPDGPVRVALVAHRLGKRAVLRLESKSGRRCFVRLGPVANEGAARRFTHHQALARSLDGNPDVAVAEPLLFDPELGIAVFSALSGSPLHFKGAAGFRCLHAAVKALDILQFADHGALRAYEPQDEIDMLTHWHGRVAALCPEHAPTLDRAFQHVCTELTSMPAGERCFCHRDFHEGQILIGRDGRAGILDFDTAVRADPMIDVGNLMAHVFLHGQRAGLSVVAFEKAAKLGAGFDRPREDQERCRIWRRAALLRLACIYAVTTEPRPVIDALFAEAVT